MSQPAVRSPRPVVTFAIVVLAAAILPTIVFATTTPPGAAPETLVIATPRGESRLVVRPDSSAGPAVSAAQLLNALRGSARADGSWMELTIGGRPFRFLLGAPVFLLNDRLEPLAGLVYEANDSLFLPFQFVAEILPQVFAGFYRYDAVEGRLLEAAARPKPPAARLPNGLLPGHVVTVDAGHGGVDPGNPGVFFPRGVTEKTITLQMGFLLRDELKRRGIGVVMTRTSDTLIDLADRGAYCTEKCDLFVSLHVNSLARRRGYTSTNGFETYFLAEAKTEEAERVEAMENEALRFEAPGNASQSGTDLGFILRDLQLNEYLRESARIAEMVQDELDPVHTGVNHGVKQANFAVLRTARRPAILIELGYSTNESDARLLINKNSQKALATAIADAVVDYLLEYERKTGSAADSGGRGP
jgi:N-acetylmuramoyl-L-alanine amidase